jgi:hypothetical protein
MKIKIYQINSDRDIDRVKFMGLQEMQQMQRSHKKSPLVNPAIYDEVFSGEVDCDTLEGVFTLFNTEHPPTHRGHSLSMSDIVQITENSDNYLFGCFYCDRIGFESIRFDTNLTQKPDNLLRAVMLEPGKPAYEAEIANELHAMQHAVDGYIEVACPFSDNAVLIANEEGLIHDMNANRIINGTLYVGPLFIVGDNGDGEFCSLTDEQVQQYLGQFSRVEFFPELENDYDEDQESGMTMS